MTILLTILSYIAIGLVIGSLSGIMGIGGGVLLVPVLIWFFDFEPRKATGTSLAILIPPIGLPAALEAYRKSDIDFAAAVWIAAAFTLGAYTSRSLIAYVDEHWFRLGFGLLMIFVAVRFIVNSESETANAAAGFSATVLAWLGYLGLKLVGRRREPPRNVGQHIQEKHEQGWNDSDYHI